MMLIDSVVFTPQQATSAAACRLSYKGLGEPICLVAFGPLSVGAFYIAHVSDLPPFPACPTHRTQAAVRMARLRLKMSCLRMSASQCNCPSSMLTD